MASDFTDPERLGIMGMLAGALLSNLGGVWVSGKAHRERIDEDEKRLVAMTEDRNYYRNLLFEMISGIDRKMIGAGK